MLINCTALPGFALRGLTNSELGQARAFPRHPPSLAPSSSGDWAGTAMACLVPPLPLSCILRCTDSAKMHGMHLGCCLAYAHVAAVSCHQTDGQLLCVDCKTHQPPDLPSLRQALLSRTWAILDCGERRYGQVGELRLGQIATPSSRLQVLNLAVWASAVGEPAAVPQAQNQLRTAICQHSYALYMYVSNVQPCTTWSCPASNKEPARCTWRQVWSDWCHHSAVLAPVLAAWCTSQQHSSTSTSTSSMEPAVLTSLSLYAHPPPSYKLSATRESTVRHWMVAN